MRLRAYTLLLAALAALPQLASLERAGPPACVDGATTSIRLHDAPHPKTETARASLLEILEDRFSPSPFAAATCLEQDRPSIGFHTPVILSWPATPSTPPTLPRPRAPPALS